MSEIFKRPTDLTDLEYEKISECINLINKPCIYIEIGVLYGTTFSKVLRDHQNVIAIGFDLFNHTNINSLTTELKKRFDNFILVQGDCSKTIARLPQFSNVVVLIDADHSYKSTLTDFLNIYPKVLNGYILFHDSGTDPISQQFTIKDGGPFAVVNDIKNNSDYKLEYLGLFEKLTVFKK